MSDNQPEFQSVRYMRDNTILLSIANEYLSEEVYVAKIGKEIKKILSVLKKDIIALKKQFPGKFTQEVNTDNIVASFNKTAEEMLSCSDEVLKKCSTGKLGLTLNADLEKITEAIEKIWHQVKGSDVQYTATDSISGFFSRLNVFSGIASLFSSFIKILFILFIILLGGFSYLFFTMENEGPVLKESQVIMGYIEEKQALLKELENKKADAQKDLKKHKSDKLLRKDKIAIITIETKIQEYNQEIHSLEGQIELRQKNLEENNEKLETLRNKPFLDKLLKQ